LLVFNKLDTIEKSILPLHLHDMFALKDAFDGATHSVERVFVSAQTGEGISTLRQLLAAHAASPVGQEISGAFEHAV
jgi:GTPase